MRTTSKIQLFALLMAIMAGVMPCSAQSVRTVSGDFTFYGDGNQTRNECKRLALEGARLQALAKEFGTTLSQVFISDETIKSGEERNYYSSLSETEVKGEWLEDIGEPNYEVTLDTDDNFVVRCRVKGKAREISNEAPDFTALVLRNGTSTKNADTRFRSGDDMRLYFKAPVDGYLIVYLADDQRNVSTLLPYSTSEDGSVKVKHGKEYIFFDSTLGDPKMGAVEEMQLCTDEEVERDSFYILFSPKPFTKANDSYAGKNLPRSLSFNDFHRWLSKNRKADPSLGLQKIDIIINK